MSVPLYQQIANLLRAEVISKASSQPEVLPSERELCELHKVARSTIRGALAALEAEGLVRRKVGWATVTNPEGIATWQRMRHSRRIMIEAGKLGLAEQTTTYFGQIYQGILTTAEEAGYSCGLRQTELRFPTPGVEAVPENPKEVLGVILTHILSEQTIAMHAEAGYPVVCLDHWPVHPLVDGVMIDCFAEAHQAVEFLASQGHREMFYIGNMVGHGANRRPETDALQMEAGYRRATQLAGLEASARRVLFLFKDDPDLPRSVEALLRQTPRPTAGIIFSHGAMGRVLDVMQRMRLRCPEDVSLITKTHKAEPLEAATLETDAYQLGQLAVETLLARAAGKRPAGQRIVLASRLHRGPTVAVAPAPRTLPGETDHTRA